MIADYEALKFWFDVVQFLGTVAIGIYVWWDRRKQGNASRFTNLERATTAHGEALSRISAGHERLEKKHDLHLKRTSAIEDISRANGGAIESILLTRGKCELRLEKYIERTATLERELQALPSRDELAELTRNIGTLTEKLGVLDGRLGGINRAVDLLNQHHLSSTPAQPSSPGV